MITTNIEVLKNGYKACDYRLFAMGNREYADTKGCRETNPHCMKLPTKLVALFGSEKFFFLCKRCKKKG